MLRIAKDVNEKKSGAINRLRGSLLWLMLGILTTKLAVKKLVEQILPRMQGSNSPMVRVKNMPGTREGDNARLAFIEYAGNETEKYEKAVEKERVIIIH